MDNNPSNADLDMIEALLATMQQNSGQLYDEVDEDDDDDYEDDDDEDDEEEGYYGEHNIQALLNPYGSGGSEASNLDGENPDCPLPTVHTMNFLQGLLNMNSNSIPGMAEIEAAIGSTMNGGMSGSIDSGSGSFLPNMQSIIPNMGTNMAGALAGAFAGGMLDYSQDGDVHDDYDDDEDDEDDDDVLSDEEDEEDDDDDDLDDDDSTAEHFRRTMPDLSGLAMGSAAGALGGLMAANLMGNNSGRSYVRETYQQHGSHMGPPSHVPALMPPPRHAMAAPLGFSPPVPIHIPISSGYIERLAVAVNHSISPPTSSLHQRPSLPPPRSIMPIPIPMVVAQTTRMSVPISKPTAPVPVPIPRATATTVTTSRINNTTGGTVSRADPLAALLASVGGVFTAIGPGVISPVVSNLLGNSGGTTVINKMITGMSPPNSSNIITNDSFNSSSRTLTGADTIDEITTSLAFASIISQQHPSMAKITEVRSQMSDAHRKSKDECEDDKASLGTASVSGSETSGRGKSDTESVGKKTPSPVPEGTESTNSQDVGGSCASITDLASATESMRDSDTDNHSEVHNVTTSLSDLDNDVMHHEQQVQQQQNPYHMGLLPVVIEHPTYGWGSMLGLDTAKEALKNLFVARAFPKVFEGEESSCKGILLFGPSGSGKTCLARALAKEANNALFVGISARHIIQSHPLDALKFVRVMFDQARLQKPAVILFDEIEALSYQPNNESAMLAKDEILAQVRGQTTLPPGYPNNDAATSNEGIMIIGTTNQPWLVEDELRKLFVYNIHVKLPGEKPRHELFRMFLQNLPNNITDEEFSCLVSKSEGYSAADINTTIRQASQRVSTIDSTNPGGHRLLSYDDLASVMTQYQCRFDESAKQKYSTYIRAATHKSDKDSKGKSKDDKERPKGVKKLSRRIAKSFAAAVLSVID